LAVGVGCGGGDGGGDFSPSAVSEQSAQEQAEAQANVRDETKTNNAEVQREYQLRKQAEAPTEEEREAGQVAADFYAILAADEAAKTPDKTAVDSGVFCELMSEQARSQTVHYAKVASGIGREWDCESAVEFLVIRAKGTGTMVAAQGIEVIGVNAKGDRAIATVRVGKGPATSISLVREDGEWRLASSSRGGGG